MDNVEFFGLHKTLKGPFSVLVGTTIQVFGLEFTWWGAYQWYKWRWQETHIDLGFLSIYGIKQPPNLFWRGLALSIKPMRKVYHKCYVYHEWPNIRKVLDTFERKVLGIDSHAPPEGGPVCEVLKDED